MLQTRLNYLDSRICDLLAIDGEMYNELLTEHKKIHIRLVDHQCDNPNNLALFAANRHPSIICIFIHRGITHELMGMNQSLQLNNQRTMYLCCPCCTVQDFGDHNFGYYDSSENDSDN